MNTEAGWKVIDGGMREIAAFKHRGVLLHIGEGGRGGGKVLAGV